MPISRNIKMVAAAAAVLAVARPAAAAPDPMGVWIDHTGRGAVEITDCGGALCGRIVWLKEAANNEVCGVQILGDVKPAGPGVWDKGWIYDPERDSKFSVELKPLGEEKLRVTGYLGTKFLSETMTWQRARGDLERCKAGETTADTSPAPAREATVPKPANPVAAPPAQESTAPARQAELAEPDRAQAEVAPTVPSQEAQKPRKQAKAEPRECKLQLPWFTVMFPCPE
jgi:uncharacterized protein (DUF2147 family)